MHDLSGLYVCCRTPVALLIPDPARDRVQALSLPSLRCPYEYQLLFCRYIKYPQLCLFIKKKDVFATQF